jgi:2-phosphoglycolate phosphatase
MNMKKRVDLILFDLDGTLADTGQDLAASVNFTRAQFDLPPLAAARIHVHVGLGVEHLLRHTLPVRNPAHFHEILGVFTDYYEAHLLDKTVLYPGVRDILEYFRGKRRVVATNKIQRLAEAVVRGLGVDECFDLILGGDSAAEKKPHPALLTLALARFQTAASSALMVGDGDTDIEAGKRAGVMTCGVTYGIGDKDRLRAAAPDVVIEHLAELRDHFD